MHVVGRHVGIENTFAGSCWVNAVNAVVPEMDEVQQVQLQKNRFQYIYSIFQEINGTTRAIDFII